MQKENVPQTVLSSENWWSTNSYWGQYEWTDRINKAEESISSTEDTINNLQMNVKDLEAKLKLLVSKTDDLEHRSGRNNLRITGMLSLYWKNGSQKLLPHPRLQWTELTISPAKNATLIRNLLWSFSTTEIKKGSWGQQDWKAR